MTIGERLKDLRLANGFTLKEVADRIGVSEGTVQRYESDYIFVGKSKVCQIKKGPTAEAAEPKERR